MLIFAFELSLIIISFMVEILTLAPQYSVFGNQTTINNGNKVPCSINLIDNNKKNCHMTNVSMFYNRISISFPFFSTIFYFVNWVFIIMIGFSLIYGMFCYQEEAFEDMKNLINEDEDEEKQMLKNDIN